MTIWCLTVLASDAPVVVAPAMHLNMASPATSSERGDAARSRCPPILGPPSGTAV